MKDIYSKAIEVIAWLGHAHHLLGDFEWASTTFKTAIQREFGTIGPEDRPRTATVPHILYSPKFWKKLKLPYSYDRAARATTFSAVCRWFNRSWIVQEAVLAKQVNPLCGSTWLSWSGVKWLGMMLFDSLEANRKRSWHAQVASVRSIFGLSCLGIPTAPERAYDQLG
jgi:hypothetical protein